MKTFTSHLARPRHAPQILARQAKT